MDRVVKEEKIFGFYTAFPPEIRRKVLEELQPYDRCRFTRCSTSCRSEVKSSKHYIHALVLRRSDDDEDREAEPEVEAEAGAGAEVEAGAEAEGDAGAGAEFEAGAGEEAGAEVEGGAEAGEGAEAETIVIQVVYHQKEHENLDFCGYKMKYGVNSEKKYVKYVKTTNNGDVELWNEELPSSADLLQSALKYFKGLLKAYQNSIQVLDITEELTQNQIEYLGIGSLNKVQTIHGCSHLVQLMPLLRKQLEMLTIFGDISEEQRGVILANEMLYRIPYDLNFKTLKMNNEQFRRLSAEYIVISIGELTENDVFNFIKDWQSGNVREWFYECTWHLEGSNFDTQLFFNLLGTHRTSLSLENNDRSITAGVMKRQENNTLTFITGDGSQRRNRD